MFSFLFRGIAQVKTFFSHTRFVRAYRRGLDFVYQREMRSRFAYAEGVTFGRNMETEGTDCIEIKEGTHFGDFCIVTAWESYRGHSASYRYHHDFDIHNTAYYQSGS